MIWNVSGETLSPLELQVNGIEGKAIGGNPMAFLVQKHPNYLIIQFKRSCL
jgi:hypothetical protein